MEKQLNYHHNASLLDDLAVGDLIEIKRGLYSHWAVYFGDKKVAHLAGEDDDGLNGAFKPEYTFTISGAQFNKAQVCIEDFWPVVAGSKAYKNNKKDSKWSPCNPATIVKNILSKLGKVGYNLLYSNCEHFANWCRYGIPKSDQVDNALTGIAIGAAAVALLGAIYALAKNSSGNTNEKEKKEKEIEK